MTNELKELSKQCITSLHTCADYVAMFMEGDEREAEFSKLKSLVEEYCMFEAQNNVAAQALEKAKKETDPTNLDSLQERFNMYLNNLAKRCVNVSNHSYMTELNKRIEMGIRTRHDLDESDLAITNSQDQYIDPITKRPVVDPVRNKICGHIYEKDSIMGFIAMRKKMRCPVAGCGNREPMVPQHLISDEEMKFRLAANLHSTMIQDNQQTSIMELDDSAV